MMTPPSFGGADDGQVHMPPEMLRVIARGLPNVLAFFKDADKDGSGQLSKDEFIKAVRSLGLTREQAQDVFGIFDHNADGGISLAEILAQAEDEEAGLTPSAPSAAVDDSQKHLGRSFKRWKPSL